MRLEVSQSFYVSAALMLKTGLHKVHAVSVVHRPAVGHFADALIPELIKHIGAN